MNPSKTYYQQLAQLIATETNVYQLTWTIAESNRGTIQIRYDSTNQQFSYIVGGAPHYTAPVNEEILKVLFSKP